MSMFSKLNEVESRYEEVNLQLQKPDIASNQKQYRSFMKELSDLEKIVVTYRDFKKKKKELDENKRMLTSGSDAELKEMIREEIKFLELSINELEAKLKLS